MTEDFAKRIEKDFVELRKALELHKTYVDLKPRPVEETLRPADQPVKFTEIRQDILKLIPANAFITIGGGRSGPFVVEELFEERELSEAAKEDILNSYINALVKDLTATPPFQEEGLDTPTLETIVGFYVCYGIYYEFIYNMSLLYQVLLREYESLKLLDLSVVTRLRRLAVIEIARLFCYGNWKGARGFDERTRFRERMIKEIRLEIRQKADKKDDNERYGPQMAALCLSGGGIRSATFALGVLQGLAKHGLLNKFHYLSTVSGGGYAGSWLTAWIHRKGNIAEVQHSLGENTPGSVEPREVTHLRSYTKYMSPVLGAASADTWTLIAIYLRNLLLNWTVFVPLIAAFLLLPRLLEQFFLNGRNPGPESGPCSCYWMVIISSIFGCAGMAGMNMFRPSLGRFIKTREQFSKEHPESRRTHFQRIYFWLISLFSQNFRRDDIGILKTIEFRIILICLLPVVVFTIGITAHWNWADPPAYIGDGTKRALSGALAAIFGVLGIVNWYRSTVRHDTTWNKILETIVIALCILIALAQTFSATVNTRFFGLTVFTEVIVIAAFIVSRALLFFLLDEKKTAAFWDNTVNEFSISFLTAALWGMLLYVADENLLKSGGLVLTDPPQVPAAIYTTLAVPLFLLAFFISTTVFIGIASKIMDDMDREWTSRLSAWYLIFVLGWIFICAIVFFGPSLLQPLNAAVRSWVFSIGGIAGVITLLFGYYSRGAPQDGTTPGKGSGNLAALAPQIAAPIFAVFLAIIVIIATKALVEFVGCKVPFLAYGAAPASELCVQPYFTSPSGGTIVVAFRILIMAAFGCVMGLWININRFSLHATYRDRLIRAYLGASRAEKRDATANSFTGLDEQDNIEMKKLRHKPFHVVNMTLNIAKSASLRWQNRKAESFTVSPFHCGSSQIGEGSGAYRPSELYGAGKDKSPISLGTAAAISGAAASPNMGYYTQSAPVSALMALFNIRLGWWLGNPGRRGIDTFRKNAPEFAPGLLFNEAFGRTEDTNRYIYLSDGGHFDNLGIYEMVLRRCRFIVVSDASADPDFGFSDLGSAIHKIRVDMGIPIEFKPGEAPVQGRNCSIGHIRYSVTDGSEKANDGILLYFKPTLDGDEPVDIVNYKNKNDNFPHESTADQMYSETQFESYRSLGFHMVDSVCGKDHERPCKSCLTLQKLRENAELYLKNFKDKKVEAKPEDVRARRIRALADRLRKKMGR